MNEDHQRPRIAPICRIPAAGAERARHSVASRPCLEMVVSRCRHVLRHQASLTWRAVRRCDGPDPEGATHREGEAPTAQTASNSRRFRIADLGVCPGRRASRFLHPRIHSPHLPPMFQGLGGSARRFDCAEERKIECPFQMSQGTDEGGFVCWMGTSSLRVPTGRLCAPECR